MHTAPRVRQAGLVAVVLAVAVAGAGPLAAQTRERAIYVSAVDENGEPVTGLGAGAFVIREDGARREVIRVTEASEPIDLILLVDNSSAASGILPVVREALTRFVRALGDGSHITLVGLADRPTVLERYTRETDRVVAAIDRMFPMPQTGMTFIDAVAETVEGGVRRNTPRTAMVAIITDGVEFTNRYARDVTRQLDEARVALHAVTIGRFDLSDEHSRRERGFLLEDGTRRSGGQWIRLLTHHALGETLQRLARELTSQYEVVYAQPDRLIPPDRVEVTSARQGVRMRGAPRRDTGGG